MQAMGRWWHGFANTEYCDDDHPMEVHLATSIPRGEQVTTVARHTST